MIVVAVATILTLTATLTIVKAESELYFTSSPSSYVGQGKTFDFKSPQFTFTSWTQPGLLGVFSVQVGTSVWWEDKWDLKFGTGQAGEDFQLGRYEAATHWDVFSTNPVVQLSGGSSINYRSLGWFEVNQFERNDEGVVTDAEFTFFQRAYDTLGATEKWEAGELKYHPFFQVPETSSLLGVLGLITLVGFTTVYKSKKEKQEK